MKTGQGSLEFILLISVLLAIATIYSSFITERILVAKEERFYTLFKDGMSSVRTEFLIAASAPEGYVRTFTIPATIDGKTYTLQNLNNTLVANTSLQEVFFFIPPSTGAFVFGENTLRKQGGELYLN